MRPAPRNTLSDRVIVIARIGGAALTALTTAIIAVSLIPAWLADPVITAIVVVVIGVAALAWFVLVRPKMLAMRWRYELLDHELYLQQGIITLVRHNIPYIRIQNVDTSQGPIDRYFGVSSVSVSTAGGSVAVPMLDDEVAAQLRDQIDVRARAARERDQDAG